MTYGKDFILTLFTKDPELAAEADRAGVDRIGVDIERLGKRVRQAHLDTWISDHEEMDLGPLRSRLSRSQLFARCNPIHADSAAELDRLLAAGVEVIMLPFFSQTADAERFIRLLDGRATPVLLMETASAVEAGGEVWRGDGGEEEDIGLNDLYLSLGWRNHFEVLVSDLLERTCEQILQAGLRLGVGGLGKAGDITLPIPADLVYSQMARLHARAALISRAFFHPSIGPINMKQEVRRLRANLDVMHGRTQQDLQADRDRLRDYAFGQWNG